MLNVSDEVKLIYYDSSKAMHMLGFKTSSAFSQFLKLAKSLGEKKLSKTRKSYRFTVAQLNRLILLRSIIKSNLFTREGVRAVYKAITRSSEKYNYSNCIYFEKPVKLQYKDIVDEISCPYRVFHLKKDAVEKYISDDGKILSCADVFALEESHGKLEIWCDLRNLPDGKFKTEYLFDYPTLVRIRGFEMSDLPDTIKFFHRKPTFSDPYEEEVNVRRIAYKLLMGII